MSMRLIAANKLIESFEKVKNESTCLADIAQIIGVQCVIDEQPTAYDVDAVVEQLEEACISLSDYPGYVVDIEKAIEIVKGGGAKRLEGKTNEKT